jgi:hypothetical protein
MFHVVRINHEVCQREKAFCLANLGLKPEGPQLNPHWVPLGERFIAKFEKEEEAQDYRDSLQEQSDNAHPAFMFTSFEVRVGSGEGLLTVYDDFKPPTKLGIDFPEEPPYYVP